MHQITLIRKTLLPHLTGWHGALVTFLALFLVALFRVKTVDLSQLATGFMGKANTQSNYKRLQRFFSGFELNYFSVSKLVVNLMQIPQPWVLSVERTNWKFGNCCHNILTLGIVHNADCHQKAWEES